MIRETVNWLKSVYSVPSAEVLALREPENAKREKLSGAERQARTRAKRKAVEFAHLLTGGAHAQA